MNGTHLLSRDGPFTKGIFRSLFKEQWMANNLPSPVTFERKSHLFIESNTATHIFIVETGLVKTYKQTAAGRPQMINVIDAGGVLGLEALSDATYELSAAALNRVTAYKLKGDVFQHLLTTHPKVSIGLVRLVASECARLHSLLVDIGTKKALARVASCLLFFMDKQAPERPRDPFTLPVSRQEMGAFLGLSPETVSRQLKTLVSNRVIRLEHKRLTVLDLHGLTRLRDSA